MINWIKWLEEYNGVIAKVGVHVYINKFSIMENQKEKRVVQIEIDDNVKKLTITGEDKDQQVVMREEISNEDLENVTGGGKGALLAYCPPYNIKR